MHVSVGVLSRLWGGVCVRNELCASPASVHKVAGKSEDAQKAVVLWFDSPASLSGSCQKQAAVSEQGPIALPDFNLIRCVWKKHTVCVWGGCHYDKAKPATAGNCLLLYCSLKWKCEAGQVCSHCLRNRCAHKAQAANHSARVTTTSGLQKSEQCTHSGFSFISEAYCFFHAAQYEGGLYSTNWSKLSVNYMCV